MTTKNTYILRRVGTAETKSEEVQESVPSTQSNGSWEREGAVHPQIKARREASRVACEMATNAVGRGWTAQQASDFKANLGCNY